MRKKTSRGENFYSYFSQKDFQTRLFRAAKQKIKNYHLHFFFTSPSFSNLFLARNENLPLCKIDWINERRIFDPTRRVAEAAAPTRGGSYITNEPNTLFLLSLSALIIIPINNFIFVLYVHVCTYIRPLVKIHNKIPDSNSAFPALGLLIAWWLSLRKKERKRKRRRRRRGKKKLKTRAYDCNCMYNTSTYIPQFPLNLIPILQKRQFTTEQFFFFFF